MVFLAECRTARLSKAAAFKLRRGVFIGIYENKYLSINFDLAY